MFSHFDIYVQDFVTDQFVLFRGIDNYFEVMCSVQKKEMLHHCCWLNNRSLELTRFPSVAFAACLINHLMTLINDQYMLVAK